MDDTAIFGKMGSKVYEVKRSKVSGTAGPSGSGDVRTNGFLSNFSQLYDALFLVHRLVKMLSVCVSVSVCLSGS